MSLPLQSAYNASKFAVRGFTEALEMELSGSNINVSCVHPGGIKTSITRNSLVGDDAISVTKEQLAADFDKAALTTPAKAAQSEARQPSRSRDSSRNANGFLATRHLRDSVWVMLSASNISRL